jgi:thymidylate kinase
MIIVALEGCHGCGKTELCELFASRGYACLDEGFLDMPPNALHPQTLTMELAWVSAWMQRILAEAQLDSSRVIITDRSPFSAVFYTRGGRGALLAAVIEECLEELRQAGIEFYTVHMQVEAEALWARIQNRLVQEPERALYKENSRAWMDEVKRFYDSFGHWSFTVDNSKNQGLHEVVERLVAVLAARSPKFNEASKRVAKCGSPLLLRDDAMSLAC